MRRSLLSVVLFIVLMIVLTALPALAQDVPSAPDGSRYRLETVATAFERPLLVTHAGDGSGRLFIVEQAGYVYVQPPDSLQRILFMDVNGLVSRDANERGLLGLAFHPDYAENGQFFINYTDRGGDTVVARYTVSADDPNRVDVNSGETLVTIEQPYPNHNGGHLAFGPDGYLYIGMGDGGSAGDPENYGQNPAALLGKMLRIDVDGAAPYAVPPDNPFVGDERFAPEIWAWGLRNPWRFSFDRLTGDLYIADVGQNQFEEVNFQAADSPGGENYGWRYQEGTPRYSGEPLPEGLTNPFAEYSHREGCSVTGGYVYRGAALPELQGIYFFGDYCTGFVWASWRDADGAWQTERFLESGQVISSFGEDEAGELYLVDHGGTIYRLVAGS